MNRLLSIFTFLVLTSSCAPRVTVDQNSKADFSKYRTFTWMDSDVKAGQNPLYYNQIATENVENTMSNVLQEKGFKETTTKPDLLIGYHFFVENKTQTVATPSPVYGPYMGWGRWGYG
ncbi:MAG: DUF4136 domain-containing protein, partial [Cytophagaceae bacterium]